MRLVGLGVVGRHILKLEVVRIPAATAFISHWRLSIGLFLQVRGTAGGSRGVSSAFTKGTITPPRSGVGCARASRTLALANDVSPAEVKRMRRCY